MRIKRIAVGFFICVFSIRANAGSVTVTTTADDGAGSLRAAIASANEGGTIQFDPSLKGQTIVLTSNELLIDKSLTISGPGADALSVQRSTDSGTPEFRIFEIASLATVTIEGLTISNGLAQGAGQGQEGGGIYSKGALTLTNVTISTNSARFGGGIFNDGRGGNGQLTINNCTLTGNTATASLGGGGGIYNYGIGDLIFAGVILDSSTITKNSGDFGAGIFSAG